VSGDTVLVVDDESSVRFTLEEILTEQGLTVLTAGDADQASARLLQARLVITDLAMPGRHGLELVREVRTRAPETPVIVITARGSERVAVECIKAGAYDYLSKPFDLDELVLVVRRALEASHLRVRSRTLATERKLGQAIIGESPPMARLLADARRVAARDITTLLTGETGTGKEVVASLIHAESRRAGRPFVRFNCAALPADLAEAELFGHGRGAFTGAVAAREGYCRQADGGTLLLDEIGELPLPVQAKMLRLVQEGEIQPVGSTGVKKVDLRIVACTNRNLREEARAGRFREDLYYRLAVVELVIPPLRERREDIPALAELFRARYAERFGLDDARLSPALLQALCSRDWPGNVRELENTLARALALSTGGELGPECLDPPTPAAADAAATPATEPATPTFRARMASFERDLLARALDEAGGNQSEAARRLGLSRPTLLEKLKKHNLHPGTAARGPQP
jgi:two-component system, NtrC family, response regulator AtoC